MSRFFPAIRIFWRTLTDANTARLVDQLQQPAAPPAPTVSTPAQPTPEKRPALAEPARSGALNLLEALQREARLIDFMKESLASYSDAQIGAAVRDVHRDCSSALERMFALRPVIEQAEGSTVEVGSGNDADRVRLTGNVAGQPPFRGTLRHGGWQATKIDLPEWNGSPAAARIVAPAEVELP